MGFLMPKVKTPTIPPMPRMPTPPTDKAAEEEAKKAAELQRQQILKAKGISSTILTGGLGDTSAAPIKMRTLLGETS